jgi:undecaprenyl phosphate-alpha-L-ara4N flippase subunit ArnE
MAIPPLSLVTIANPQTWLLLLLNGWVIGGVIAWVLATVLWIVVLNRAPLAQVYLLGSLNYLIVPLLSRWLFAEPLSRMQVLGMLVIVAGVVLTLIGRSNATLS